MSLETARERSIKRKALEVFLSLILTIRASKDDILEMYLNDVPLGQRGSFAIFGVSEASRLFFGKDVSNISLAEAATIAGVIQSPSALSPFNNGQVRCAERRNVVLQAMADGRYVSKEAAADKAEHELRRHRGDARSRSAVLRRLHRSDARSGVPGPDDHDHRARGRRTPRSTFICSVDCRTPSETASRRWTSCCRRRKRKGRVEAALIAVDPKTGEILAFVGRPLVQRQSQYGRAIAYSRRQPGSVFKPFVYLTAFELTNQDGRTDITPATITNDDPETFEFDDQVWTPENYEKTYDGPITFRHALAHSRNLGTIHVAQTAGYDNVAALWARLGVGNRAEGLSVDYARRLRGDAAPKSRRLPRSFKPNLSTLHGRFSSLLKEDHARRTMTSPSQRQKLTRSHGPSHGATRRFSSPT